VGDDEGDNVLDVAQWKPTGDDFCELHDGGECDSGTVSWGTSDPYEPKSRRTSFLSTDTGYEFVTT
jgi:hypothetical protein